MMLPSRLVWNVDLPDSGDDLRLLPPCSRTPTDLSHLADSEHGWRRTLPAAFSPLLSDGRYPPGPHGVEPVPAGWRKACAWPAAYLCSIWPGAPSRHPGVTTPGNAAGALERRSVLKAALVNLLNPNPILPGAWCWPAPAEGLARGARARRGFVGGLYASWFSAWRHHCALATAETSAARNSAPDRPVVPGAGVFWVLSCAGVFHSR